MVGNSLPFFVYYILRMIEHVNIQKPGKKLYLTSFSRSIFVLIVTKWLNIAVSSLILFAFL